MSARLFLVILLSGLSFLLGPSAVSAQPAAAENDTLPPPTPDPLAWFNQPVFQFNLKVDQYVLRPVATAYDKVMPDAAQRGVGRFLSNLRVIERVANNALQRKFPQAGQEVGRFFINTTLGGMGFLDVADDWFGWREHPEDFGQTLATYGVGPGPYLVLPFYGPSTVRDAVGFGADGAMNPMNYTLSTLQVFAVRGGTTTVNVINYRSQNLELFEQVDRYSVDLYGAVQDGYLQRREQQIEE